ncbi:MAG: FHA domain-containing protein [Polyangia bacterium]
MNCPSCNRPNAEDLNYCDYCGTPLTAPAAGKRKTEFEPVPGPGPVRKRVTEFEPASEPAAPAHPAGHAAGRVADPFDPFGAPPAAARPAAQAPRPAPPVSVPAAAPSSAPSSTPASAQAPSRRKATEYIPGSRDPFAEPSSTPATTPAATGSAPAGQAQAAVGRRIVGWVITFDEHPDGLSFLLREGRNVVGREPESDIAVGWDHTVSGTHAYLIWRLGRARIADANTQNGTFLNEEDVLGQIEVHDGDVLRVGRTRFLIRLLDQAKVSALWDAKAPAPRRD